MARLCTRLISALSSADLEFLLYGLLHDRRNNPNEVINQVKDRTGESISRRTLRRWGRKAGMRWTRFRKLLRELRNPDLFDMVQQELSELEPRHGN